VFKPNVATMSSAIIAASLLLGAAVVAIATLLRHEKPARTLYELLIYRARVAKTDRFFGSRPGAPVSPGAPHQNGDRARLAGKSG
jgi:hypothetical protein